MSGRGDNYGRDTSKDRGVKRDRGDTRLNNSGSNKTARTFANLDRAKDITSTRCVQSAELKKLITDGTGPWKIEHMCGPKCTDAKCRYIRAPDDICRSMAVHGHCRHRHFDLRNKAALAGGATDKPYPWCKGCKFQHIIHFENEWFKLADNAARLSCAEDKTEEQWTEHYNKEHEKDRKAQIRSQVLQDARNTRELLNDSVKVQAEAAKAEKIAARKEGRPYDPVRLADGLTPHLQLRNQESASIQAATQQRPASFNLFARRGR